MAADAEWTAFIIECDAESKLDSLSSSSGSSLKRKIQKAFSEFRQATLAAMPSLAGCAENNGCTNYEKSKKQRTESPQTKANALSEVAQIEVKKAVPIFGSFECVVCRMFFRKKDRLKKHFCIHTGDRGFRCSDCIKSTSWKAIMARVPVSSSSGTPVNTPTAMKKSAATSGTATAESATTVGGGRPSKKDEKVGTYTYKCSECRIKYSRLEKLNEHMKKEHNIRLDCVICGKIFKKESKLKRHCRQHPWDHFYRCDLCGKPWRLNDSSLPVPAFPPVPFSPRPACG